MTSEFIGLDLTAAEGQLVDACLRHEWALDMCREMLPRDGLRGHWRRRYNSVLNTLAVMQDKGLYDETHNDETASDILAVLYRDDPVRSYADWWLSLFDDLWDSMSFDQGHVQRVLKAVLQHYRLQDEAFAATDRWLHSNPLVVDDWIEDAMFSRMEEALRRHREERMKPRGAVIPPPAPQQRPEQRGTINAFRR